MVQNITRISDCILFLSHVPIIIQLPHSLLVTCTLRDFINCTILIVVDSLLHLLTIVKRCVFSTQNGAIRIIDIVTLSDKFRNKIIVIDIVFYGFCGTIGIIVDVLFDVAATLFVKLHLEGRIEYFTVFGNSVVFHYFNVIVP